MSSMDGNHEILVIGTGFAGIGMGVRLREMGITDFAILEQADGVGGTWRDNH
jgi:cation diffusion facilitator CzcD-associated flavoprotein CzcO